MAKFGSLGGLVFEVRPDKIRTFQKWDEEFTWRYEAHAIVNSGQILQFGGGNLDTRTLSLRLRADFTDVETDFEILKDMGGSGQAHDLILGSRPHGKFVIERLTLNREVTDHRGRLILATIGLTLRRYE